MALLVTGVIYPFESCVSSTEGGRMGRTTSEEVISWGSRDGPTFSWDSSASWRGDSSEWFGVRRGGEFSVEGLWLPLKDELSVLDQMTFPMFSKVKFSSKSRKCRLPQAWRAYDSVVCAICQKSHRRERWVDNHNSVLQVDRVTSASAVTINHWNSLILGKSQLWSAIEYITYAHTIPTHRFLHPVRYILFTRIDCHWWIVIANLPES